MGKRGREIVGVNVKQLITELNKAYADEWIAFYYYTWAADFVEGLSYPAVASELDRIAKEELEHAGELADRIYQLGGEPERDFEDLQGIANCKKITMPKDPRNLDGILKAIIEQGERCAIDAYSNMLQKLMTKGKDPVTFHIIRHIMSEEIEHEEAFENLLSKK
jgi:bacterioferritin